MRFIFTSSMKPGALRAVTVAQKTKTDYVGRKYLVNLDGPRTYIAVRDDFGRATEWFIVIKGVGKIIKEVRV